jgi:hypothetical protein
MVQHHAPATLYPGKDPVPIVQEAEWAPGPVWTGAEILAPTGFGPRTVQSLASRYADWATRPIEYVMFKWRESAVISREYQKNGTESNRKETCFENRFFA